MAVTGLSRALVQHGRITETELTALQEKAKEAGISFIEEIIHSKVIKARELAVFCSLIFGVPLLDLDAFEADLIDKSLIDPKTLAAHRLVPLHKRGNRLFVATSDPTNLQGLEEIRFKTNMMIEPVVVEDDKLGQLIKKVTETATEALENMTRDTSDIDLLQEGNEQGSSLDDNSDIEDAPVVKFIQKVLLDAINAGVSDIHFEPFEKFYRIRYRLDGLLMEVSQPPVILKEKIASRIKVISKLDIAEKRIPQDGRLKLVISKTRAIDFRVSTLPTLFGEKIVMRILDPSSAKLGIDALGYDADQKAMILDAIHRPYGMILVTGPTGSGKTVSLYTCLNILNEPGINIATAEDPAEINLPGVNQVNVNEKAGLTFAAALRSFLRQDPDIIMVGEIRDLETADIAIKAAQTGHMVLSTLHTNDAPKTITRLLNMGVAPFNVASSVILITAQRLARRLCVECKRRVDIPRNVLLQAGFNESDLEEEWTPYEPVGCTTCKGLGYKGRVGIYEVMPISEEIAKIIMRNGTSIDIAEQAKREGVRMLRRSGLLKVKQGLTSLQEVEACTNS
ncbi:MAG: type IV-A pilus assembly ATPase PilB [Pseudomonadota bacterium]